LFVSEEADLEVVVVSFKGCLKTSSHIYPALVIMVIMECPQTPPPPPKGKKYVPKRPPWNKRRPSKLAMCCGLHGSADSGQETNERAARLTGRG
jgi:hypothetical protein